MFLLPDTFIEIKNTTKKGVGVFTRKKILAGTVISDYLGIVINIAEYNLENDKCGLYLMYYSDKYSIYPDLSKPGPHLVNHSCSPNCWVYIYHGHTLFFALQNIDPGEELTISYLLSPNDGTCTLCPHSCKCESKRCTGTMHLPKDKYKIWKSLNSNHKEKGKRIRLFHGMSLPPLFRYPKIIPIDPIYAEIYL